MLDDCLLVYSPHLAYRAHNHTLTYSLYLLLKKSQVLYSRGMCIENKHPVIQHQLAVSHTDEPNKGETAVCGSSIITFCLLDDWGGDHWLLQVGFGPPGHSLLHRLDRLAYI